MALPRSITNLQVQSGDTGAILSSGRTQANQIAESTPDSEAFGLAVMDLLRNYQGAFSQQQFNAQEQQTTRAQAPLPPDLANMQLSPADILSFKKGEIGAVQPTVTGAEQGQKTVSGHLAQIADIMKFQTDSKNKARDDARAVIKDALTLGGADSLKGLTPELIVELEKTAGYPKGYIQGLTETVREREIELKRQNAALVGGLNAGQINTTTNQIRSAFDNEQIVKDYNKISGQVQFVKTAGKTPTDDISRIYAFASVMDPGSSVKEGEYATIQDYATALLQRYGLKAKRIFSNTGFLTDEARRFLQNTLQRRLDVSQSQYNNVAREYQRQIDDVRAGRPPVITQYNINQNQDSPDNWQKIPNNPSSTLNPQRFTFNQPTTGGSTSQFLRR